MPFSIPEHKIDEVRQATDIVELVSGYVTLKKKGQNFFGLCPFHTEKTPSFSVNPDKEIFHCFGCSAGGNAYTFLMQYEGMSFPEAVKFLAQRAGIQLDFEETDETARKETETLYYINEFAARFFQEELLSTRGKKAMDYLQNRGYKPDDIQKFGLGYAPQGWDGLIQHAKKETVELQQLVKAGLVLKKAGGGYYDRFRDRVMFPIWNLSGRAVGFGGRIIQETKDTPKYINSPETAVYEKGKLLYGLFQNRDEIRQQDRAIFVEGYTDLMSLVSAGIRNVAATLGTALTEHQARLIHRYTKNVILMYDNDIAGSAAALRGADILIENGLEVFVNECPEGLDPDSFVKQSGAAEVQKHIENAKKLIDYKLNLILAKTPEQRGEAIRSVLNSISKYKDRIQRSLMVRSLSEKLEIDEKVLWSELKVQLHEKRRRKRPTSQEKLNVLSRPGPTSKLVTAAEDLVRILIKEWNLAEFIFEHLDMDMVSEFKVYPILTYLNNRFKSHSKPADSDLINRFNEVELSSFIINALNDEWSEMDFQRWAIDCISAIKNEDLQKKIRSVREEMREAQQRGEPVKELVRMCMELEAQKNDLFKEVSS
ncbi:MAG: DNA primase [bacterium]